MSEEKQKTDDPVAVFILGELSGAEAPMSPDNLARAFYKPRAKKEDRPDSWRKYLPAVRQQALYLARSGRINIIRKGEVVDPKAPIKGLFKLAIAEK
ncbi:DUF3253 domain-containing protein [Kiloniella laminariae]|uniref:DUF3253 domain-containing protein n=1 Tax=Kiloniella laminariae TaxID=454162 RepID=A0ABT4LIU9_9PROT|nr:DUF3253 domain-containing protein [Kiloniella laminariae]MCZ4281001.1 DUF3253 domain-containing protein [Kiloniella laminariae]